jgi:hypothetical protein
MVSMRYKSLIGIVFLALIASPLFSQTAQPLDLQQEIANGWMPDPNLTPGDIFPDVTADTLSRPGYTKSVRDVPESEKERVFAEYGIAQHSPGEYEVDHLIPLELGGSNDIKNLWPEPYHGAWNAHVKDRLENKLHSMVEEHEIALDEAQKEIATDWITAYKRYVVRENVDSETVAAPSPVPDSSPTPDHPKVSFGLKFFMLAEAKQKLSNSPDTQTLANILPHWQSGVFVIEVVSDSPADAAGIKVADIITKFGDVPIKNRADLDAFKNGAVIGESYEVVYFRYSDDSKSWVKGITKIVGRAPTTQPAVADAATAPSLSSPANPAPAAQPAAAVTFVSVTGGYPGGYASVTIQATPGANCSISYTTPSGRASVAVGLGDQTADADGKVTWSWKIGNRTKPGTGRVMVTCNGQSATSDITIP